MKAGRARARITIQTPPANAQFSPRTDWATIHTARAIKRVKSGGEKNTESGRADFNIVEFETRYREKVKRQHRLLEGGDVYEIEDIRIVGEKNINMILVCKRGNRF